MSIAGCAKRPATGSRQAVTVTCQTSFAASQSPERLTAVFTPADGSSLLGSSSSPDLVAVGLSPTSLALDVSNPTVETGSRSTYTATIAPRYMGSVQPTGAVEFMDGTKPIASCATTPLGQVGDFSTAVCTVRYRQAGHHQIAARYLGDANFADPSNANAQAVQVLRAPFRVRGTVTATMQWSFYYTPTYTKVLALIVNGASSRTTVRVTCRGAGCPFAQRKIAVPSAVHHRNVNLVGRFKTHRLRTGARIDVAITHPGWVGKHYTFQVRRRRGPQIGIACLAPGTARPGAGCY